MTVSPLAPDAFPPVPQIAGVTLATAASEMKYRGRDDMLLMRLADGATTAGVFTRSDTAAAPVTWCRGDSGPRGPRVPFWSMPAMPTPLPVRPAWRR